MAVILERVKSEGIAHISYFVGSENEAVVIDPRRDCHVYVDLAFLNAMRIKYIFETHRNEDYAIGSIELANLTSAEIYHGPGLAFKYGQGLKEKQTFSFGELRLTAIHTPGHTDESVSYVLSENTPSREPILVFTGDTLLIGDVGRTDLSGPAEAPRLAKALHHSIFRKLLPLGDGVILCPAHGAGSLCGGAISKREHSTLGIERLRTPVLQRRDRDDFVQFKIAEHHERPPYFRKMEKYNLEGPPFLGKLPHPPSLSVEEFRQQILKGALVVDTRLPPAFGCAHITGSYSIWLEGLPSLAGWVLPYHQPILLVLENDAHLELATRYLIRLGYDNIAGYLRDGMESWYKHALPTGCLDLLSVERLQELLAGERDLVILDVRRREEWEKGHIEGALHIYVGHLQNRLGEVPPDKSVIVICSIGRRASLGASILLRGGFQEVSTLLGGMEAWENADFARLINTE